MYVSTVDVGHHIVERAADGDEVGDFRTPHEVVDNSHEGKARRYHFEAIGSLVAPAFEIDAECTAGGFDLLEVTAFGYFDDGFGLHGIIAFGDIIDELFENVQRLLDFGKTHIVAGIGIALVRQHFVELHLVV